jgi:hypothetical protein
MTCSTDVAGQPDLLSWCWRGHLTRANVLRVGVIIHPQVLYIDPVVRLELLLLLRDLIDLDDGLPQDHRIHLTPEGLGEDDWL